ncbi:MAG: threonine--tRNA ligase [Firmicutes bacterium]|nr:threonine--tRNA ligase [Bacillota bacterium]
MKEIKITLKDLSVIEVQLNSSALEVAAIISEGLARVALACKIDGVLSDLRTPLTKDCALEILTFKDEEGKNIYRHSCAHILAMAVKSIYPDVKLGIGPHIRDGFYYDFDFPSPITQEDFVHIEAEMQNIIKADLPITKIIVPRKSALSQMRAFEESYKIQLIEEISKDNDIFFYKMGDFSELCSGPHISSTGKIKAFKLTQLAGAYWRGSEKNKMLTRIYGTCYEKKADLTEHLERLEEAKRRDHNKLGRELGFFMTEEKIGQGLPLLMPKGAKFFQILQRFVEDEEERRGYVLTKTPSFAKSDLYKISGHWDHYKDSMFIIGEENTVSITHNTLQKAKSDHVFALRPMTCPYQYMIYKNGLKSYRDLPIKYNETAALFRNENSGEMHGLIRVRQFHLSDGHVICTPSQLEKEFKDCFELSIFFLDKIGMLGDVFFRFSKRDLQKDKYIGSLDTWNLAESSMKNILDSMNIEYTEAEGEAAFYGPKLDIQFRNVYGKEDTLMTIQVDLFLSEKFDMTYVAEGGEKKYPYIIHRSAFGCYERVMAALIEKYSGSLPLWMSPMQIAILPVTDRAIVRAKEIEAELKSEGLRCEVDYRNEKLGFKIRAAQVEKIPYMLVLGDKEIENNMIAIRERHQGDLGTMTLKDFLKRIKKELK